MTESRVRRTAILFVMVLVTAGAVHSQTPTGGIRGLVSDNPGVAVPAVALVATNIDTNLRYPAVTNSDGIFRITYLPPGRYLLSASKPGYKAVSCSGVEVRTSRDVVLDIRLEPGDPSETIQLDAGHSGRIQRDTSQVSFSFTAREIQDLPINSPAAGLDRIALLLPGLTEGFAPMNANGASLSVNGGRDRSNNFSIDGADNNDPSVGGPSYFMVNPAAVAEFQVITGNSTAEHGRNLGGEVNIVSRTGSNRLNGSLSWAHQDRKNWDSLTNLERRSGQYNPAPNLINVFGYGIGGPIIRDRLFFYSSGLFLRNPGDVDLRSTSLAPTPEGIQALKSSFPDSPAVQYYADYSAFALPAGNPTVRQDVAQSTINVGGVTIPVAAPRRVFSRSNNRNDYTARLDLEATQKDKFWMRTFFQDAPNPDALLDVRGWNGDAPVRTLQVGGAWVRNLSPLSVNELRFGYARHSEYYGGGDGTAKGRIPDSGHLESAMTFMSFPGFLAANGASLLAVGPNQGLPQGRFVESFQIVDNFDRVAGKHQLRIGLDIRRLPSRGTFLANANGAFSFRDGKRLAENNPNSLLLALGPATLQYGETDQFYYLQDDWRVRENLTLNLGLRYENTGSRRTCSTTQRWRGKEIRPAPLASEPPARRPCCCASSNGWKQLGAACRLRVFTQWREWRDCWRLAAPGQDGHFGWIWNRLRSDVLQPDFQRIEQSPGGLPRHYSAAGSGRQSDGSEGAQRRAFCRRHRPQYLRSLASGAHDDVRGFPRPLFTAMDPRIPAGIAARTRV